MAQGGRGDEMKFKELKIGDKFRMDGWMPGVVSIKIEPTQSSNERNMITHREVATGIGAWHVKDDDDVILVESSGYTDMD